MTETATPIQAPDPNALPLSTAMRMAREAKAETWIHVANDEALYRLNDAGDWFVTSTDAEDWEAAAGEHFTPRIVEVAACRLVTPAEGAALLRGES